MTGRSQRTQVSAVVIPASSHKKRKLTSFAELDDELPIAAPVQNTNSVDASENGSSSDDDDDDDAAPEEETNITARKGARRRDADIKELNTDAAQKRKRAAEAAQKKADAKKAREEIRAEKLALKGAQRLQAAAEAEAAEEESGDGAELEVGSRAGNQDEDEDLDANAMPMEDLEAALSSSAPPKTNRLDPALFAAAFAAKGDGKARGILDTTPKGILRKSRAPSAKEVNEARKLEKRAAIRDGKRLARGKDGEAIRRLKDGRTVVRALATVPAAEDSTGEESATAPTLPAPLPLDASQSLPPARARAFKKRALGHKSRPTGALSSKSSSGPSKGRKSYDPDDPLGLNDPAFAPGGEFAHIRLDRKPQREKERAAGKVAHRKGAGALGWKGEGGRVEARKLAMPLSAGSRPATGFARSRMS